MKRIRELAVHEFIGYVLISIPILTFLGFFIYGAIHSTIMRGFFIILVLIGSGIVGSVLLEFDKGEK